MGTGKIMLRESNDSKFDAEDYIDFAEQHWI